MKSELLYVELCQGSSHNGPAWIGYGQFNKSGKTIYFNGKVFSRSKGIIGNHIDIESLEEYWISGVKRNGADRHKYGSGKIQIDKLAIGDYLEIVGQPSLSKSKFIPVELINNPITALSHKLENRKLTEERFDRTLLFKNPKDLQDDELQWAYKYYSQIDLTEYPIKSRKSYIITLEALTIEINERVRKNNIA